MERTIITYGTFDMLHIGHVNLFKRLKSMGTRLIVAVSTDEFNLIKGKKTLIPYEQRKQIVESIRYVDMVIAEENWDQKVKDIQKYDVDIFSIGDDWKGKFDFLKECCEVIYLERTENISTTQLKQALSSFLSINKDEIIKAFEVLESLKQDLL
ncbi:MAG TPA: glycerol-3-phosphate cytidylyltransferase [Bacteroidia bacterium]|nr:glycerol-3-phosphate cytidylyltransferase [Bacteroidia bacterium]